MDCFALRLLVGDALRQALVANRRRKTDLHSACPRCCRKAVLDSRILLGRLLRCSSCLRSSPTPWLCLQAMKASSPQAAESNRSLYYASSRTHSSLYRGLLPHCSHRWGNPVWLWKCEFSCVYREGIVIIAHAAQLGLDIGHFYNTFSRTNLPPSEVLEKAKTKLEILHLRTP